MHNYGRPFEYVHSDLWGPKRVVTRGVESFSSLLLMISLEEYGSTF